MEMSDSTEGHEGYSIPGSLLELLPCLVFVRTFFCEEKFNRHLSYSFICYSTLSYNFFFFMLSSAETKIYPAHKC